MTTRPVILATLAGLACVGLLAYFGLGWGTFAIACLAATAVVAWVNR